MRPCCSGTLVHATLPMGYCPAVLHVERLLLGSNDTGEHSWAESSRAGVTTHLRNIHNTKAHRATTPHLPDELLCHS